MYAQGRRVGFEPGGMAGEHGMGAGVGADGKTDGQRDGGNNNNKVDPGFQNALRTQSIRNKTIENQNNKDFGQFFGTRVPTYQAPTFGQRIGQGISTIGDMAGNYIKGGGTIGTVARGIGSLFGRPPPTDPMSFGQNDILGYNQLNIAGPVKNSFTDIIGDLYSAYTNISPVHLGIKGVKKIGDFVKEIQKNREIKKAQEEAAAADAERAAMNAAYASQSQAAIDKQNAVTGGRYDGAGSSAAYGADPTGYSGSSAQGGIQGYGGKSGTPVSQQRRPYGTGGIVTL